MHPVISLPAVEWICRSTIRIEATESNGATSCGTGFAVEVDGKGGSIPLIITNNHVVEDAPSLKFRLSAFNDDGHPIDAVDVDLQIEPSAIFSHPNPDIDLCAIPLGPVLNNMTSHGRNPMLTRIRAEDIASDSDDAECPLGGRVLMAGYPIGLWDEQTNTPVVRSGVLATSPAINWHGLPQFLIDCAVFPGSSGSPVFWYEPVSYTTKAKTLRSGTIVKLLGVLYAGPVFDARGTIKVRDVPTARTPYAETELPTNLGLVLNVRALRELIDHTRAQLEG